MDDPIRSLAHDARNEVERGLDLDHELNETLARDQIRTTGAPETGALRRRVAPWAAAAAVAFSVGAGGLWLARGSDDGDSVITADPPVTEPATVTDADERDTPPTDPSTTAVVSPVTTAASPTTTTTTTVVASSTTTVEPITPVIPVPGSIALGPFDVIARGDDGDVWWYPAALTEEPGEPVLLIDRADPRVVPSEGEGPNIIDEVAGTFDGSLIYSDCCEPVSGNTFAVGEPGAEVDRSSPAGRSDRFELWGVGANPQLEPGSTHVVMLATDFVNVVDMTTGDQQFVSTMGGFADDEFNASGQPFSTNDVAWTSNGTIALLGRTETGGVILTEHSANDVRVELNRTELDFGVDTATQNLGPLQIVGSIDGSIFVAAHSPDGLRLAAIDSADWTPRNAVLPFDVPTTSDFVRLSADGTTATWIVEDASFLQRSGEELVKWRDDLTEIWFPSIETSTESVDEFCEQFGLLQGERPESYVGSQEQIADIERLRTVAPDAVSTNIATFSDYLSSGAIDSQADPDSNLIENWPEAVQTAVEGIQTFGAETC